MTRLPSPGDPTRTDEFRQGGLRYGIDERPRFLEAVLYGWQHTLVDISPFVLPLPVAIALGLDDAASASFISFGLVAMGLATLIQTIFGNRLPIVQGPSATLVATMAPLAAKIGGPAMWGGIFVGAVIETVAGASRLVGLLRRFLPPRICGLVIVVIGLSLGNLALRLAIGSGTGTEILLAVAVIVLVFVLQAAPSLLPRQLGATRFVGLLAGGSIFFAIWFVGIGLGGLSGTVDWDLVQSKPWLSLPTLFPFGSPFGGSGSGGESAAWQFLVPAILVILVGYIASMVESIGDYAATCNVVGVEYTKEHMNRGIAAEGLGGIVSSVLGSVPCTSYTQNIGIIASTRVASRYVVQIAAVILMAYGLCPKFGALLVAMPRSVLGGVFVIVCGMIVVSGLQLLRTAAATAPSADATDGWVVGIPLVAAISIPAVVQGAGLSNKLDQLPLAANLLLTNSIVIAMALGIVLEQVSGLIVRSPSRAR